MMTVGKASIDSLRNNGNEEFKHNNYQEAINIYTQAITRLKELPEDANNDLAILYKNRAMAYLKLDNSESAALALADCNKCLEIASNDLKAQFRRILALEQLGRFEDAYLNAKTLLGAEPKNVELQAVLKRLYSILQEKTSKMSQIKNKVDETMRMCFGTETKIDQEKRSSAFDNLLVLARSEASIDLMLNDDLLSKIIQLCKVEKNNETVILASIRTVGEICKSSVNNIVIVLRKMGISWFIDILDSDKEERVNASMYCIQTILNTLSGMTNNESDKPVQDLCDKYKKEIDTILICLTCSINNVLLNGIARDAVIELVMRNVHYTALSWAERFVEIDGVERLLECVCEMDEFSNESSLRLTKSSKVIVGACLSRIYENMYYDEARQRFMDRIEKFVKNKLVHPDFEWKVKIVSAITVLLRSTLDVGSSIISWPGIMNMILAMAECETELEQKIALECIIAAASKKDKAQALVKRAVERLKVLYKSKNEAICVRALVSLCKIGSIGGTDASVRPFQDGSTVKLADACIVFLKKRKDLDSKKWASEGLAYLTMDAEVKEKFVEDKDALSILLEMPKSGDESVLYGVVTTLVNLCNAYDKQEILPEMKEMAKFAKYHVPQDHELDDEDFVQKRIDILANKGVVTSLNCFAKTPSYNSRELISRVLNAICSQAEQRGLVVQQGGVKFLLKFATEGSKKGKRFAAQALARIGITMNPEVAFSGQRSLEVVRPLVNLLDNDCSALENFEAMMALCNLASLNETTRLRILNEKGLSRIQIYMFEDHQMLKRAAVQAITNLMLSERVREVFEGENDLTKYLMILCSDEDLETSLAAAGALCILVSNSDKACTKVFETNSWLESFQWMLAQSQNDLQYRGVFILSYLMGNSKEVAAKLIDTNLMEILMALSLKSDQEKVKNCALDALKEAEKWGIIKKT